MGMVIGKDNGWNGYDMGSGLSMGFGLVMWSYTMIGLSGHTLKIPIPAFMQQNLLATY